MLLAAAIDDMTLASRMIWLIPPVFLYQYVDR